MLSPGHPKQKPIVTLSTTKAEFEAATACACQATWLRKLLDEVQCKQIEATPMYCDNSSAIKWSKIQFFMEEANTLM